ncbi:hypothetical protein MUA04_02425 [Enterobacteriaceae bacterium H11S18]|uniref:hypothetical protein n=1 Tax=Dryocola clanedunensis TaxID=2925396 RepID=UPI0022F07B3B|nr:hypothetical protein [Dryocola clanedunensis]MCT4709070.1 hypothetical protein [Dryocola clanedunensis]
MYRTFTDALIHTRAKTILRQHLWPETLEPEYALQHCQGDGVMFTGVLTTEDLLRILPHMHTLTVSASRTLQRIVSEHGVTVRLSRNTWRYSHSGCATLSVDGFPEDGGPEEEQLLNALQREFDAICHKVEAAGYLLTDGTFPQEVGEVLLSRHTENIELRIVAVYPEECGYCDTESEWLNEYIDHILQHKRRVLCLRFEVYCAGEKMAESWTSETVIPPGEPVRKWLSLDEIRYVASSARSAIEVRAAAFRSFLKAA